MLVKIILGVVDVPSAKTKKHGSLFVKGEQVIIPDDEAKNLVDTGIVEEIITTATASGTGSAT